MTKRAHNFKNITGQKFGHLTAISYSHTVGKTAYWLCRCDCGNNATVIGSKLRTGHTQSCGCKNQERLVKRNTTHNKTYSKEYNSWRGMRERCYNPNHKQYRDYGGRGIKVCALWQNSFEAFFADMGTKPSPRHTIDRIDTNAHYSCGHCEECLQNGWNNNCQWADFNTQARNRRSSIWVTHNGESITLQSLADLTGISYTTLYHRHNKGYALTTRIK